MLDRVQSYPGLHLACGPQAGQACANGCERTVGRWKPMWLICEKMLSFSNREKQSKSLESHHIVSVKLVRNSQIMPVAVKPGKTGITHAGEGLTGEATRRASGQSRELVSTELRS